MHIYEGILAATPGGREVLVAGAAVATIGTAIGLYKLDYDRIPKTAVLSAAFFIASFIQVPLPFYPSSVHLVLGGLMGLVLGWSAFPAVMVALVLQAAFGSSAGLTTLGLNTVIMALPAVACHYLFHSAVCSSRQRVVFAAGAAAGATAILLGAAISAGALMLAKHDLLGSLFLAAQLPLALAEGLVTGSVVVLLRQVRPEVIEALQLVPAAQEATHG
jgi:cobalt/nickel transport system permease protein